MSYLDALENLSGVIGISEVYLRQDFTEDEKAKILRRWENVTFRIYGMFRKDARTAVGDYVRLAWSIVKEKTSATAVLAKLSNIGAEFPIAEAVKNLSETNCYEGWQEELRYFFYRYEEYLARKAGQNFNNEQWNRIWEASAADSIEHILAQSTESNDWVHWLGNLLVLPPKLNSKLGAKWPAEKVEDYCKTGLLIAQEVVDVLSEWSNEFIEDREEYLLGWAQQEWAD